MIHPFQVGSCISTYIAYTYRQLETSWYLAPVRQWIDREVLTSVPRSVIFPFDKE